MGLEENLNVCKDQYAQLQRQYSGTIEELENKFLALSEKFGRMQTNKNRELVELKQRVEDLRANERQLKMEKENLRRPKSARKKAPKKEVLCPKCSRVLKK